MQCASVTLASLELQNYNRKIKFHYFWLFFIAQLCYQFVSLATQQKHLVAHFLINHHYKTADQLQTKLIIILCNASYYIHKHFIFAIFSCGLKTAFLGV